MAGSIDIANFLKILADSSGSSVTSVFTRTGAVTAQTGDYSVTMVSGAAPLASPALTGTPTAPTTATADSSTKLATTALVDAKLAAFPGGAVTSVFTRTGAVVAATGDYTVAQVTGAAPSASPSLTGVPTAPTATAGTNTTQLATTAFDTAAVLVETTRALGVEALKSPIASPAFTGTPTTATTPAANDNSLKLATTAYADRAATNAAPVASSSVPIVDGTGAIGTGTTWARADHVHPTDTSRAPLAARSVALSANSATPAINVDVTDELDISAQTAAITSFTSGLTGTPGNGQKLIIRIAATTGAAITWGASFVSSGVATLPATTVTGKTITVGLRYNATAAKWICLAVDATGY